MRLKEIEQRLGAIRQELEQRAAELTADQLTALEQEVQQLQEERNGLMQQAERRTALLAQLANGVVDGVDGAAAPTVVRTIAPADGSGAEERNVDRYDTMEYRRAFMEYVTRGTAIPAEYRSDAFTTTTDVGAAIPTTVLNQIVQKMEKVGMILALVTRTAYKGGVTIPTSTVKPVATWVNERGGSDKQKYAGGSVTFSYHKLRCAVAVSLEVDTMAIPAFEALIISNIVEAMTKSLEQAIIDGAGTNCPKGILKETVPTGQTINSAAPAYKDLVEAEGALPVAYEGGAMWCMSKKTFMAYYGLTDTNGQPIGRVNYGIAGKPEYTLLGRPVVVCDYVKNSAAASNGDVFAFLFNFKDYVLNTNYAMGVKKYEDNDTDDMVTKGIMLVDGKVVDANSLVVVKKAQG